jgi:2-polyprenyl-3-methyl-5-hydroxy-6-metoxy-1,4-benzoquinol methylase
LKWKLLDVEIFLFKEISLIFLSTTQEFCLSPVLNTDFELNFIGRLLMNTIEEGKEITKHNNLYQKYENPNLYIKPHHYNKFDTIDKPTHGYIYTVKSLGDIKGKRILELGCGTGWFSVILAKRGGIIDGIDISPVAIDIAKQRAVVNNVENCVKFHVMSFYDLGFSTEYFDIIVGLSVLHHSRNKYLLAESMHRVLKRQGVVFFNEPFGNSSTLEKLRLYIPVKVNDEDNTHWNEQIKYSDLVVFNPFFKISFKEFQFFSRLNRVIKPVIVIKYLGLIDLILLSRFKWLRPYARNIVIRLDKLT